MSSVTNGTVITAAAGANAKGTITTIGTADIDADGFYLIMTASSAPGDFLFDILFNNVVKVENVQYSAPTTDSGASTGRLYIPLNVRRGDLISASVQSSTGSNNIQLRIMLCSHGPYPALSLRQATTYGAATGDSGGLVIDPGGVANTLTTVTFATLTQRVKAFVVCTGNRLNAVYGANANHSWNIAIRSGQIIRTLIEGEHARATSAGDSILPQWHGPFYADAYPGEEMVIQDACSNTDATDRLIDFVVITFT